MALKSATVDLSVARPASIEFARFRIVPHCRERRTISGRGCKFTGEVRTIGASPPTQALADSRAGARPAPPPDEPAGAGFRADRPHAEFEEILDLTAAHRLVTRRRRDRQDAPRPRTRTTPAARIRRRGLGYRARVALGSRSRASDRRLTLETATFHEGVLARAANGDFDGYDTDAAEKR